MWEVSIFIATLFLAYAKGSNDNFKGVATLFGSRITSYQTAILWATFTTFAGALTSIFFADSLVQRFSGQGIVRDAIAQGDNFHIAVAIATALTVMIATNLGLPVSTAHSLIGAIFGASLVAIGLEANSKILLNSFVLPLFISPIIAISLSAGIYSLTEYIQPKLSLAVNQKLVDNIHYISAGLICFIQGFYETPRLVSLVIVIEYFSRQGAIITIAMAMGLGGLISSQRIAETISLKITPINPTQGLSANIITSILVIIANFFALPISTTHVAVGSILGAGIITEKVNKFVVFKIIIAWILTLPTSTIFSGLIYRFLQR
ncbi:anion permease [Aliinostoc sp. HNIBRCY26]|uniref:inorganic phosphate transporter n=1 Tax=Aliinostoc sp. HNIBRCY26 TaxID=3418997 RepID=UPI003CFD8B45